MWRGAYKVRVEVDGWTPYVVEAARPGGGTPLFPLALEPERAVFAALRAGRRTSAEFYPEEGMRSTNYKFKRVG